MSKHLLANGYRIISLSGQAGQAEQEKQEDDLSRYLIKELIAFLYEIPSDEILSLLEEKYVCHNLIVKFQNAVK